MAGYDPKRPRPVVDRDEPAPVEALIEPAGAPPEVVVPPAPRVVEPAAPTVVEPAERPFPPTLSDTPIAPAPPEGTANRAVMFVMAGAAAVSLLALLVLRRRRH
jgi:LPXTG-motif cell wall-anchored protein